MFPVCTSVVHFYRHRNKSEPQREKMYLLTCESNEDSNQPAHLCSLISVSRMKKFCILGYPNCAQRKFCSDCTNAQAALTFPKAHMSEGTFADVAVHNEPQRQQRYLI